MQEWLTHNWLALLGALTGTVALVINYLSYRNNRNKDRIDLTLSCAAHPKQAENVRTLLESEGNEPWNRPNMVEVYTVTVRNRGSINAPLSSVGVITSSGTSRGALVSNGQFLQQASTTNIESLPPKSERTFKLYLNRGEDLYSVKKAFAVDQTGKRWEANV
jgi:hypothetical protein